MKGLALALSGVLATAAFAADKYKEQDRLSDATVVLSEVMNAPDKGIPNDLFAKAQCAIIIPGVKKAAFVVGAQYGRGFAVCRKPDGRWGNPAAMTLEGGSVGFQIGGSDTDLILLAMNRRGIDKLMSDKFTLGADASVAAGPVGRTAAAATDAEMHAEMLAWSRSRGVFAGIALNGASLRPDRDGNEELYGRKLTTREVFMGTETAPPAAQALVRELNRYSDRPVPH
jgi:lipid-binding SYLF domain-containing protein